MVRRNNVNSAPAHGLLQGGPIQRAAQRRVHLEIRVERFYLLVGQRKVMRRRLGGYVDAVVFRARNQTHRFRGTDVLDVKRASGLPRQFNVAPHHQGLGIRGDAGKTKPLRGGRVDDPRRRLPHHFAMRKDGPLENPCALHGPAHHVLPMHGRAVIAESHGAGLCQQRQVAQFLRPPAARYRGDRIEPRGMDLARPAHDVFHRLRGVCRRVRVRHRGHSGEPARKRGTQAGLDGLVLIPSRLAQVHVHVYEPGHEHHPSHVHDHVGGKLVRQHRRNLSVLDHDMLYRVKPTGRVDDAPVLYEYPLGHGVSGFRFQVSGFTRTLRHRNASP